MRVTLVWIVVSFVLITLSTMDKEAMVDGISSYGFPQTFYSYTGGKAEPKVYATLGFNPLAFIVDVVFAALLAVMVNYSRKYLFTKSKG